MAAGMDVDGSSNRNKAILAALSGRLQLDPKKFPIETVSGYGVASLFSAILKGSEPNSPLLKKNEIMKWVEFANNFPNEADGFHARLVQLDEDLKQKSVLLGDGLKPSEADIIVFSVLHSFVKCLTSDAVEKLPNVIRWIDYIQNKVDFGGLLEKVVVSKPEFDFSIKKAGNSEENFNPKKAVDEKKVFIDGKASDPSKGSSIQKKEEASEPLKQKKAAKEEKKKAPEKESAEKDAECSVSILNIQIGIIRKASKHPSADRYEYSCLIKQLVIILWFSSSGSLLVEEIDLGDGNLRQVVSGLAKFYSPEDLLNRRVVLITNVKPGKLRDVMSAGLVLCASNQDHTVVEPLIPPEGAALGERVSFSGYDGKPEDVLNPKKKQLEKITPYLNTDDKGVATFKGIPAMTSAGPCTSSIPNASVK